MNKLMEVKDLGFSYGRNKVLEGINFTVEDGDYLGIIGPNGSGKTTLIKILLGILEPCQGQVRYNKNLLAGSQPGYLPQNTYGYDKLFPATVGEVVATGLLARKKFPRFYNKADHRKVDAILEKLKIASLKNRRIGNLSGGQEQRVLLARSLISEPKLLVLDEPSSGLDPKIREDLYKSLEQLNREGSSIIVISHDLLTIDNYINKVLFINRGVIFFGDYGEFKNSEDGISYLNGK